MSDHGYFSADRLANYVEKILFFQITKIQKSVQCLEFFPLENRAVRRTLWCSLSDRSAHIYKKFRLAFGHQTF